MDCIEARESADDAAYDLLDETAQAAFEAHLRDCPPCRRQLEDARERRTVLRKVPPAPVPRGLADRVLRRARRPRWRWAAAAALVAALGGLLLNAGRSEGFEAVGSGTRVRREEPRAFRGGISLEAGDALRTATAEAATIRFPDGSSAALGAETRVRVGARRLELDAGEAECRVVRGPERFVLATPAGDVTVLGTHFVARLTGATPMNRARAAGAGAVLSVAVVTGAVLVSNSRGEVTLGPGETAVATAAEAPRRADDAALDRMESEARATEKEAEALQARVDDLARAGREMLLRLREREAAPPGASGRTKPGKSPDDMMRATMRVAMKGELKTLVDKLERKLQLTPEQRKRAEDGYQAMFEKVIEAFLSGEEFWELGDGQDQALAALKPHLRADQQEALRRMEEEEAEAARKAREEERAKVFKDAAADLRLTDDQRARLAVPLGETLQSVSERSAMLYVRVMTGRMKTEDYRSRNEALIRDGVEKLREGLTADQVEALRRHLEKITAPGASTRARIAGEEDK